MHYTGVFMGIEGMTTDGLCAQFQEIYIYSRIICYVSYSLEGGNFALVSWITGVMDIR